MKVIELAWNGDHARTGLPEHHPLVRFAKSPDSLDNIICLDDTVIWGGLSLMVDAEDEVVSVISRRLRDRQLFKCVDIRARVSHEIDPDTTRDPDLLAKIEKCCAMINAKLIEWTDMCDAGIPRLLLDEAKRSPYKDAAGSTGPSERINVRTGGGKLMDLKKYSQIVANLADFVLFRAYFDRDDSDASQVIDKIISGEVEACR